MPNMKKVVQNHDKNLLLNHTTALASLSGSSRQKSKCPLNNECLSESLVYKTAISQTPSQIIKYYYGTCKKTFKERCNNILLHLGINANIKVRNSPTTSGN